MLKGRHACLGGGARMLGEGGTYAWGRHARLGGGGRTCLGGRARTSREGMHLTPKEHNCTPRDIYEPQGA
jgi:hypothetical protein